MGGSHPADKSKHGVVYFISGTSRSESFVYPSVCIILSISYSFCLN